MPKRRISNPERGARRSSLGSSRSSGKVKAPTSHQFHRFLGISLSGGKSDRSCLAVLDYFSDQNRIFLTRLFDRIKSEEHVSADLKIHDLVVQYSEQAQSLAFDVPLTIPKCVRCELKCPGYEVCGEPEIKWMRSIYQKQHKRKPKKMFTPYTQRAVDLYFQDLEDENLEIHHALGSNLGPLTARAHYIARRVALPTIEINSRFTIWRLGAKLKVAKAHLRSFRSAIGGEEARRILLQAFTERLGVFFYEQDLKLMIESHHAFDAFLCAYVGFLKDQAMTEAKPTNYPRQESWIEIPRNDL